MTADTFIETIARMTPDAPDADEDPYFTLNRLIWLAREIRSELQQHAPAVHDPDTCSICSQRI